MNSPKKILLIVGALAAVGVAGGAAVVSASTSDDNETETPISGDDLAKASSVALAHTGQGRVTDTEVGDEESYYEVEVTLDDGSEVDVQLDEQFNVVGDEPETGDEADD